MSILRTIHATSAAMRQAFVRAPMATAALARSSSNAHTGVAASAPAFAFAARPLLLRRCMGHKPPKHSSKITGHELTKALGTLDGWTKVRQQTGQTDSGRLAAPTENAANLRFLRRPSAWTYHALHCSW